MVKRVGLGGAWNIPNALTLLRIVLVPVLVGLVLYHHFGAAAAVFLVAGLTDALDGMLARILDQRTTLGRYLDPLADKLLLVMSFLTLSFVGSIPIWITIIVVSRDVIISMGALIVHLLREQVNILPSWMGKAATVMQLLFVFGTLIALNKPMMSAVALEAVLVLMLGLTVASGIHYVMRGIRMLSGAGNDHPA
ncbi:MAG: CDP-alcohol phosphatidyltransferase family protein [Nitrospiria bacterium]